MHFIIKTLLFIHTHIYTTQVSLVAYKFHFCVVYLNYTLTSINLAIKVSQRTSIKKMDKNWARRFIYLLTIIIYVKY